MYSTSTVIVFVALCCGAVLGVFTDKCMQCICQLESDCTNKPCNMDQGSLSCGWYQIKEDYWKDCGSPGGDWQSCAADKGCSEGCVKAYMDKYGYTCHPDHGCEDYARTHNGGPDGCKSSGTDWYWGRIKDCCGGQTGCD